MRNALTPTELRRQLDAIGADDVEIVSERPDVEISLSGLSERQQLQIARHIQRRTPAGTAVSINGESADTPEPSERRADAVSIENVSTLFGGDETAQHDADDDSDGVEQAKSAYVRGEIGLLELESRLEDAITVEHEPVVEPV